MAESRGDLARGVEAHDLGELALGPGCADM
jgi:hypothetical protein